MPITDPEKRREYNRSWIKTRRDSYFKGKSCVGCGSTESLELDHIDPDTKIYQPSSLWGMSDLNPMKVAELAKCQVLCSDCHIDKSKREGHQRGAKNSNSIFTEEDVALIRRRVADGESQASIAKEFGVVRSAICNIINGRSWKHIVSN